MIKEGDVVMVLATIKGIDRIPILGTFLGYTNDKGVQVLLSDGVIFTGKAYEITSEVR